MCQYRVILMPCVLLWSNFGASYQKILLHNFFWSWINKFQCTPKTNFFRKRLVRIFSRIKTAAGCGEWRVYWPCSFGLNLANFREMPCPSDYSRKNFFRNFLYLVVPISEIIEGTFFDICLSVAKVNWNLL